MLEKSLIVFIPVHILHCILAIQNYVICCNSIDLKKNHNVQYHNALDLHTFIPNAQGVKLDPSRPYLCLYIFPLYRPVCRLNKIELVMLGC